jgi:hypothetical protein
VITAHNCDRDTFFGKLRYPLDEEESRIVVWPVAIVEVTANYDEVDTLAQGSGDQVFEGPTRGPANIIDWRALVPVEATQGAVNMKVGCV